MTVIEDSGGPRRRAITLAVVTILGIVILAWALEALLAPKHTQLHKAAALPRPTYQGGSVIVPEGSAWRDAITVVPVTADLVAVTRAMPASVESDPGEVINVLPPLGGRVVSVDTHLGDAVTAGQVLVRIESADMAQARADVAKAASQLDLGRHALARAQGLDKIGGGSTKDTEAARNDLAQDQADYDRAQARVRSLGGTARTDGKGLVITAPIGGVVTTLATAPGSYINDVTQSLMTIDRNQRVLVTAMAAENDLPYVTKGDAVRIGFPAWPAETRTGAVQSVDAVTQPDTRRTRVRIGLDNPGGRLRAGMFATVSVDSPAQSRITVPDSALLMNNDSTTVFVETRPWTFTQRDVQVGEDRDGRSVITSGLAAGERVVTRGGVLLGD